MTNQTETEEFRQLSRRLEEIASEQQLANIEGDHERFNALERERLSVQRRRAEILGLPQETAPTHN